MSFVTSPSNLRCLIHLRILMIFSSLPTLTLYVKVSSTLLECLPWKPQGFLACTGGFGSPTNSQPLSTRSWRTLRGPHDQGIPKIDHECGILESTFLTKPSQDGAPPCGNANGTLCSFQLFAHAESIALQIPLAKELPKPR